jgi:hypothetical protein
MMESPDYIKPRSAKLDKLERNMGRKVLVLHSALPTFLRTMIDMITGSHYVSGDKWVGLVIPPELVLSDILLVKIARLLGKNNERFILENVQNILAARIETQEPQ